MKRKKERRGVGGGMIGGDGEGGKNGEGKRKKR